MDGGAAKVRPPSGDKEMAEAGAADPFSQEPPSQDDTAVGAAAADLSPGPILRTEGEGLSLRLEV